MANSGFPTRKQELEYDRSVVSICELLAYKVVELVKVCDAEGIDPDQSPVSTHKHIRWVAKFFESLRSVHKLEKSRYADPKFASAIKPLAQYLHERQKNASLLKESDDQHSTIESKIDTMSFLDIKS